MPESDLSNIWVYLSASPLLGLTMTMLVYVLAYRLYVFANATPLLKPVITTIVVLITVLMLTETSYEAYF